jgi:hypothetical protein
MTSPSNDDRCDRTELICAYALGTLPSDEMVIAEAHLSICPHCRQATEELRRIVHSFATWPTDVLRPSPTLWNRLLERIGESEQPATPFTTRWSAPLWEDVAPGIACMLLASDSKRDRVTMLVRLAGSCLSAPHSLGRRRAAPPRWRALDRREQAPSRRLQPGRARHRRPARLERDGLYVRVDYRAFGCTRLKKAFAIGEMN